MLAALAVVPGVATAQSIDPSTVVDLPAPVRALGSFVLVLLFGGIVVYRYGEFVDHSVDVSMDRPVLSVVYGAIAYGLVLFLSGYTLSQLSRLGVASTAVLTGLVAVVSVVVLVISGLGYAVVGTRLTELGGERRPWYGLVVGAAASALPWLFLQPIAGLAAWLAVAAVGIGGPTREWIHESRPAEPGTST